MHEKKQTDRLCFDGVVVNNNKSGWIIIFLLLIPQTEQCNET